MDICLDRLEQFFAENKVHYEVQEHRQSYTIQAIAADLHEKGWHVAKVFIAQVDGRLIMLVLPAPAHVDLDRVKTMLGAATALRAKEAEFVHLFPDCDVGAMPPFGNFYNVPIYLDRSLATQPYFVFQAGSHCETMKIATSDYLRLALPTIGDFAALPQPVAGMA